MESPIRVHRELVGLTQLKLSEKTGLNQSRLSNYERLERTPDIETARLIFSVLKSLGAELSSADDLYPRI